MFSKYSAAFLLLLLLLVVVVFGVIAALLFAFCDMPLWLPLFCRVFISRVLLNLQLLSIFISLRYEFYVVSWMWLMFYWHYPRKGEEIVG